MNQLSADEKSYISVSELVAQLDSTLAGRFPLVLFQGELFEVTRAASGHLYFSVKDEFSRIRAVMWKGSADSLKFKPEPGTAVLCQGRPKVYQKEGRLEVMVHSMTMAGAGELQKKFLQLKARLEKEGLFAEERKRPLPFLPHAIGVVTSASGAVIHDIMVRLQRRMPCVKVYLEDVRVQGEGAAREIARAVQKLSESGMVDVIIVARGGGSLEDLWAFNEEIVVRAIFAARVPVISGVGHEVDFTLADYAADVRAPTPTAAAEMVVPQREILLRQITELERRLMDFERWLQPLIQRFDELAGKLESRMQALFEESRLKLEAAGAHLKSIQPDKLLVFFRSRIDLQAQRLAAAFSAGLKTCRHALEKFSVRLEAVGPLKVLQRGYALVESAGRVVKSASELKIGDEIGITFAKGKVSAAVKGKFT